MKYLLISVAIATVLVSGCKKTNNVSASVLFYNASWSLPAIAAEWNGSSILTNPLAPGQTSGTADSPYIKVPAGTNLVTLKTAATTFFEKNIYATAASGTSFIFFDTSTHAAPARMLQLTDDLAQPDTFQIKYRVLNLTPDTSVKVDTWLVYGQIDSVRLDSASVFAGTMVTASDVQTFKTLPFHGENYTLKIKKTGTQEVYASIATYPFAVKGIYTFIFSGLPPAAANGGFRLSILRHPAE